MELYGHALLVGIDAYRDTPFGQLDTPVRDVLAIGELLSRDADDRRRWQVKTLIGARRAAGRVTEDALFTAIEGMLKGAARDGGHALFYFAGHGVDRGKGGCRLVVQAEDPEHPDVELDLATVVEAVHEHDEAKSATVVLDCCYAGGLANEPDFRIRRGRAILMSSGEAAADGTGRLSPFAARVCDCLKGHGALLTGEVTLTGMFETVFRQFGTVGQRPQLMINLATDPVVLRRAARRLDPARLMELFDDAECHRFLDWEHEGPIYASEEPVCRDCAESANHHHGRGAYAAGRDRTGKQLVFDDIRHFHANGLIETHGGKALYWVAMEGLDVWLSPLGQWYWHQRDMGLI